MPIFPFIGLAKQSKALEAGLQLLSMVSQWWAQSQATACILSQVLSNLRTVSQKPVMFRPVSDDGTGLPARVLLILATAAVSSCYNLRKNEFGVVKRILTELEPPQVCDGANGRFSKKD